MTDENLPHPPVGLLSSGEVALLRCWAQDYAAAVRLAALDEAADICDQHASCEGIAEKCAAAIRALAVHVGGTCTDSGEK